MQRHHLEVGRLEHGVSPAPASLLIKLDYYMRPRGNDSPQSLSSFGPCLVSDLPIVPHPLYIARLVLLDQR